MSLNRVLFFLKDDNGYGWTEAIYHNGGNLDQSMNSAKELLPLRVRLNGLGTYLYKIRVSDEEIQGDSVVYFVPPGDQIPSGAHLDDHDNPNLCMLVRLDTAVSPIVRRSLYLRGFADKYVINGKFTPDGGWTGPFNRWRNQLRADGWSLIRTKPGAITHDIFNYVQDASANTVAITTSTPHGFTAGMGITITGSRGPGVPRGVFRVAAINSVTSFTINYFRLMGNVLQKGKVKKFDKDLVAIGEAQVTRVGHRISGSPSDAPRGRRSARTRI